MSIIDVLIPRGCSSYPGDSNSDHRRARFQKLVLHRGDTIYVAIETKIHRYDHVLFYASFDRVKKTMLSFDAKSISYDDDLKYSRGFVSFQGEVDALLPPGFSSIVYDPEYEENESASHAFALDFEPEGLTKHTKIKLSSSLGN